MDPKGQLDAYNAIEGAGEELVAIYHSHTKSAAYPSQTDVNQAVAWPDQVSGCAAVVERLVLPPDADGRVPTDSLEAEAFAREHPERQEIRLVAGVLRGGATYCALRQRSHDEEVTTRDERVAAAVTEGLSHVEVSMRAEVADTHLTLDEILRLQPGDVIRLDANADAEITLFADRTPVHRARGGRSGKHRAVQITGPVEIEP